MKNRTITALKMVSKHAAEHQFVRHTFGTGLDMGH
jgi:hypothetical protein